MEFTKNNLPELLRYLADYMDKHPECVAGYGLEINQSDGTWKKSNSNHFDIVSLVHQYCNGITYRIKPATRTVYGPDGVGVECPAPMSAKPSEGQNYYIEDCAHSNFQYLAEWTDDCVDNYLFDHNLCYATAEDAAANCRARYGIKEGE